MNDIIIFGVVVVVGWGLLALIDFLLSRRKPKCCYCKTEDAPHPYISPGGRVYWMCERHWRMTMFGPGRKP